MLVSLALLSRASSFQPKRFSLPCLASRSCTHKVKRDFLFGADVIQASRQREIEDAGTARSDGCGMGDHLAVVA